MSESQQHLTATKWDELHGLPGFTDIYAASNLPATGDIQKQTDLAATFQQLSQEGLDDFYRGELARSIGNGLEQVGSPLRLSDLETFHAQIVKPLSLQLAGSKVYNLPPPTQGVSSLMILGIFEYLKAQEGESFAHIHGLVEATKRAFILRNAYVEDPISMSVDCNKWLEPSFLRNEAAKISNDRALSWPHPVEAGDTIWLGVADEQGRIVSYIQSVFWEFGSGVVVPYTGILWQNRGSSFSLFPGPRELAAGRLPFHTLNPAVACFSDGRVMAYGTMGGGRSTSDPSGCLFTICVLRVRSTRVNHCTSMASWKNMGG